MSQIATSEQVHTVIGLYEDGRTVVNGVKASNLIKHIRISKTVRPYRAIILNGRRIYAGVCPDWLITDMGLRFLSGKIEKRHEDTAPYR